MAHSSVTSGSPGRPRSDAARAAVLESAMALAMQDSPDDVTIKAIAARAGVGRQTIYRWWRNRGEILLEALLDVGVNQIDILRGNNLPERIAMFVKETVRQANALRPVLSLVMMDAQSDAAFLDYFRRQFVDVRREAFLLLFEEAEGAGLSTARRTHLADMLYGPLWYRLLVRHAPLDAAFAQTLTASIQKSWAGAAD